MIFVGKSPYRVSLLGGGSDLDWFVKKENFGVCLGYSLDKYSYSILNVLPATYKKGILEYSTREEYKNSEEIVHPIVREVFKYFNLPNFIELKTFGFASGGSGLGGSASFLLSLISSLSKAFDLKLTKDEIIEKACFLEIHKLGKPIGKQDQYISAYGGINSFEFFSDEKVKIKSLELSNDTISDLEDNLLLFFTGFSRSASEILKDQDQKSKKYDKVMFNNLNYIKKLGLEIKKQLLNGNTYQFGKLMNDHWSKKKNRSNNITNKKINELYEIAIQNGAVGGKLVGAGGGGFLMFYAKDSEKLKKTMKNAKLEEVRFKFDFEGVKQIL